MDAPYHESTLTLADGTVHVFRAHPTAKIKMRAYCKYCYKTHGDWWQMDPKDYGGDDVVLCRCGYTHRKDFVQ